MKKTIKPKQTAKTANIKKAPKKAKKYAKGEEKLVAAEKTGIHNLKIPHGAHKKKKLLGRGSSSGHGKTSTRGSKGQTSRSGRDFYLGFEGGQTPIIRRMPKRGFTSQFKKVYQIVNLGDLSRIKESAITLDLLEQNGLIKDKNKLVKILGGGEIKNAINIQAHAFSRKASEQITGLGGKIEIINV